MCVSLSLYCLRNYFSNGPEVPRDKVSTATHDPVSSSLFPACLFALPVSLRATGTSSSFGNRGVFLPRASGRRRPQREFFPAVFPPAAENSESLRVKSGLMREPVRIRRAWFCTVAVVKIEEKIVQERNSLVEKRRERDRAA